MSSINANVYAHQSSRMAGYNMPYQPTVQGSFTGDSINQNVRATLRGPGSIQAGVTGVALSMPTAPGYAITSANVSNSLGVASPFANSLEFLRGVQGNFGVTNPFTPFTSPVSDIPPAVAEALGSFGGYIFGDPMQSNIFPNVTSGNYGGGQPDYGGGDPYGGGQPGYGMPSYGGGDPYGGGQPGYGMPSYGGGDPYGGGQPGYGMPSYGGGGGQPGYGMPSYGGGDPYGGGGQPGYGGVPNAFADPYLFQQPGPNQIPGIAQLFRHVGGGYSNGFNLVSDGISKYLLQGVNHAMPQHLRGAYSIVRNNLGIYEASIGKNGGNANAGLMGAQSAGDAWAMVRNAMNPAMVMGYSNPIYDKYQWGQNSTFAA